MKGLKKLTLLDVCSGLDDPRMNREVKFDFVELMFAAMITVICGAKNFVEMATIAEKKLDWFRQYLPYTNGLPCKGTFRNVLSKMDPLQIHFAFVEWASNAMETLREAGVLAIDGKTIKGSANADGRPTHVLTAFASAARIIVGQIACDTKSNEIPTVPDLLKMLDYEGCLITMDAMGAQRETAQTIVDNGGDYLLQVKGNQPTLYEAVQDCLNEWVTKGTVPHGMAYAITDEKGHGRHEVRECVVCHGREWMGGTAEKWPTVAFCAVIRNTVEKGDETSENLHYLIGSKPGMTAMQVLTAKRAHWGVESYHWVMDVQFGDDACKAHTDHSAEVFNALRQIAYNVLHEMTDVKGSFKTKQLNCLLDDEILDRAAYSMGYRRNAVGVNSLVTA